VPSAAGGAAHPGPRLPAAGTAGCGCGPRGRGRGPTATAHHPARTRNPPRSPAPIATADGRSRATQNKPKAKSQPRSAIRILRIEAQAAIRHGGAGGGRLPIPLNRPPHGNRPVYPVYLTSFPPPCAPRAISAEWRAARSAVRGGITHNKFQQAPGMHAALSLGGFQASRATFRAPRPGGTGCVARCLATQRAHRPDIWHVRCLTGYRSACERV
jgi:hypothetical protein